MTMKSSAEIRQDLENKRNTMIEYYLKQGSSTREAVVAADGWIARMTRYAAELRAATKPHNQKG